MTAILENMTNSIHVKRGSRQMLRSLVYGRFTHAFIKHVNQTVMRYKLLKFNAVIIKARPNVSAFEHKDLLYAYGLNASQSIQHTQLHVRG